MQKLIKNNWHRKPKEPFACAQILRHDVHPEGLDVDRIRFIEAGSFTPGSNTGHIISVLRGNGELRFANDGKQAPHVEAGVHMYVPPGLETILDAQPGTELLRASGASASQARGKRFILRDEKFLAACTSDSQSLRWILTPQYLSRRIFLHHDPILLSKSGNPVSWFRTTMFDVAGLPGNEDGEPVFKMSYNSRTEFNVCYHVEGTARVRMAQHPYRGKNQLWGPWLLLDAESTYHLNEAAGGPEEERIIDEVTQSEQSLRNKHEVYILDGHVTLFCLFDPAPTGVERHRPGEYSDYEPLSQVLGTSQHEIHQREIARFDEMVDRLSVAKATRELDSLEGSPMWELYMRGREAQAAIEARLMKVIAAEGNGRDRILAGWIQSVSE
jgi:hypothetical protein